MADKTKIFSVVKHNQQQNVYGGKYGVYYITNYNITP